MNSKNILKTSLSLRELETHKPMLFLERMLLLNKVTTDLHYLGFDNIKITYGTIVIYVMEKQIDELYHQIKKYWIESQKSYNMFGFKIIFSPLDDCI